MNNLFPGQLCTINWLHPRIQYQQSLNSQHKHSKMTFRLYQINQSINDFKQKQRLLSEYKTTITNHFFHEEQIFLFLEKFVYQQQHFWAVLPAGYNKYCYIILDPNDTYAYNTKEDPFIPYKGS